MLMLTYDDVAAHVTGAYLRHGNSHACHMISVLFDNEIINEDTRNNLRELVTRQYESDLNRRSRIASQVLKTHVDHGETVKHSYTVSSND